jgi:hypothetical protein
LTRGPDYPVTVSDALRHLAREVDAMQIPSAIQDRGEGPSAPRQPVDS